MEKMGLESRSQSVSEIAQLQDFDYIVYSIKIKRYHLSQYTNTRIA